VNDKLPNFGPIAVLLDRDGTINRNYPKEPVYRVELFELLPRAAQAIRILNDSGVQVLVVTNQGGINHQDRDFNWETYKKIENLMNSAIFQEAGATVDDIFICEHADYEDCECRKPKTGMLKKAHEKYGFIPEESYIVGDGSVDIIAGKNFGLRTILVESGWDNTVYEQLSARQALPDHVFPDLYDAARFIQNRLSGRK